jgi:hypothetical protein
MIAMISPASPGSYCRQSWTLLADEVCWCAPERDKDKEYRVYEHMTAEELDEVIAFHAASAEYLAMMEALYD